MKRGPWLAEAWLLASAALHLAVSDGSRRPQSHHGS
jgi:hypothetical protein